MEQPQAMPCSRAGYAIHVAVGVAGNFVAIPQEGLQEGADTGTQLDQVDRPFKLQLNTREEAPAGEREAVLLQGSQQKGRES